MDWSGKSLLIFDDQVIYRDESRFGSNEAHALFLTRAAQRFGKVTFLARVCPVSQPARYPILNVCPLPFYEDLASLCTDFLRYAPRVIHMLCDQLRRCDVLWLVWPNPISLLVLILLRICGSGQVVCLFARGNFESIIRYRCKGLRKLAALMAGAFMHGQLRLWNRRTIMFVVGNELVAKYKGAVATARCITCSCLSKHEFGSLEPALPTGPDEILRLLFVGRLEPEKGLLYLMSAVETLHRAGLRIHLNIVGAGAQESDLRTHARIHGLGGIVSFHGYCPFGAELDQHYRRAHLFVLPSLTEGIPNVLIEAMAFGTPIIATRVGGVPGIIRHHENGLLVEAGSAEALVSAIRRAAESPELRERLRRQARQDVEPLLLEPQEAAIYRSLQKRLSEFRPR